MGTRATAVLLVALVLGACAQGESPREREAANVSVMSDRAIVLSGGTALVGSDLEPLDDARIVIRDGRIETIGKAGSVEAPEGAEIIDATGMTLLPGFIDAHVHIGFYPPAQVLAGGVTTVRDLAWPPERIFPMVDASQAPDYDGPTITAAGPMITVPGGYPITAGWAPPGTGVPVTTESEARAAVRNAISEGASVIKVALNPPAGPTLPAELLKATVDEAHAQDRKVTGHIYGIDELEKAIDAGIDELAHMLMSSEKIPQATIERMVASDIAIVPTMSVRYGLDRRRAIDNLRRFIDAGGKVVYGTDLGNAGPAPGIDRREIKAMSSAGMSPLDIIRSATVDSANWLGLADTGVLEKGARAEIVGIRGDAAGDAKALTDVALVVRRERVLAR